MIIFVFDVAVTAFSAEWIDGSFTAMQLSWKPVTVADGVATVYTVSYSPVVNASGTIDSAATMQKQTTSSTVIVSGLNPTAWYYFHVEIGEHLTAGGSSSADSGVGIGGLA